MTVRQIYKDASARGMSRYGLPSGNRLVAPAVGFTAAHLGLFHEAEEHHIVALETADRRS